MSVKVILFNEKSLPTQKRRIIKVFIIIPLKARYGYRIQIIREFWFAFLVLSNVFLIKKKFDRKKWN